MWRTGIGLIGLATALGALPARAAPPETDVTSAVTLSGLLDALRAAPEAMAASARIDGARAEVRSRLPWAPNPELEAELGVAPGDADHLTASVGITQALPIFAEREAGRRAAREAVAVARAEADEALRARATGAVLALSALGRARALAALEAEASEVAEALAAAAERRAGAGDLPADDAVVVRVEALLAAGRRADARAEVTHAEVAACRWLGLDPCAAPPALAPIEEAPPAWDALVGELERRSDRAAAERRVAAARAEVEHARGEARVVPIVGLGVEREVDDHTGVVWRVMGTLGVELPLWDPRRGAIDARAAALVLAEAEREATRRDGLAALRGAWVAWESAVAGRDRLAGVADLARGVVERARAAWEQGGVELERVLVLRERMVAARRALVEARWRVVATRALLELERPL